jgi:hypothetical protein
MKFIIALIETILDNKVECATSLKPEIKYAGISRISYVPYVKGDFTIKANGDVFDAMEVKQCGDDRYAKDLSRLLNTGKKRYSLFTNQCVSHTENFTLYTLIMIDETHALLIEASTFVKTKPSHLQ